MAKIISIIFVIVVSFAASCSAASLEAYQEYNSWLHSLRGFVTISSAYAEAEAAVTADDVIVMDFDETIGDNTSFEFESLTLSKEAFYGTMCANQSKGVALGVPGAVEFIHSAQAKGARVVILTARASSTEEGTRANLEWMGLGDVELILCGSSKEKAAIIEGLHATFTVGDRASDHPLAGVKQLHLPNEYYGGYSREEVKFIAE